MFGEHHVLPYKSQGENEIVWRFSFRQLGWLAAGSVISVKLATAFPPIPGLGIWGYFPYWLPFGVSAIFAFVRHPGTGMTFGTFIAEWVKCARRQRVYFRP
ncbi:hypothetical protein B0W44_15820 [Novibacillus thermophilus]|uniref:Uncharacterized protein n=1 Tax=Novibacillus thermophilus TaxID=1471761 RepID=A0A1U9KAF8_9BACL|nr:hypothetical protein B0W44_07490 [Novibacillus thermophilus]AQS56996.1 hypothetical protein B0W44_15820 [Novibacillus thermophilus]